MGVIRLPVSGDWVHSQLIVGVAAQGDDEAGMGSVTVWVADFTDTCSGLSIFQTIGVSGLTRAREVRDQIGRLAGLDVTPLPICGDLLVPALVVGVSAQGSHDEPGLVTVWISDFSGDGGGLHPFNHIEAPTFAEAIDLRDTVAAMAGMDDELEDGFDPEDPDSYVADEGEGEGEGEGGGEAPEAEPDAACAQDGVAKPRKTSGVKLTQIQMRELLDWWDPGEGELPN